MRDRRRDREEARPRGRRAPALGRRCAAALPGLALAATAVAVLATGGAARASQPASRALLPRPGGPVAGASVTATPRGGRTRVYWPGDGWLPLGAAAALPLGTMFDARHGTVLVTSARNAYGATQRESVSGGGFAVTQTIGPSPLTRLTLYSSGRARCASAHSPTVVRRLWADGDGLLQVVAANVTATTRGADWMIADRCDGTEVSVLAGQVTVRRTRAQGFGHRLVEVVHAWRTVLFAGPPPAASGALPALRSGVGGSVPSTPAPVPAAPASPSVPSAPGPSPAPAPAPTLTPGQQLDALVATVGTLGLTGQPGGDLTGDLQAAQTALTFGTTSATCTALGTVGQAIFENAGAPAGAIGAATATSLLSATVAIDAALGCSAPNAADLKASYELLSAIGGLGSLGIDASTATAIAGLVEQTGEAFVIGDDSDGCSGLESLAGSVGLVELGGGSSGGLTVAQGNAVTAEITEIQTQLSCSTAPPSGA